MEFLECSDMTRPSFLSVVLPTSGTSFECLRYSYVLQAYQSLTALTRSAPRLRHVCASAEHR